MGGRGIIPRENKQPPVGKRHTVNDAKLVERAQSLVKTKRIQCTVDKSDIGETLDGKDWEMEEKRIRIRLVCQISPQLLLKN